MRWHTLHIELVALLDLCGHGWPVNMWLGGKKISVSAGPMAPAEVIGLYNLALKRSPLQPFCAWAVFGD
jgi:hypothetical protein